MVFKCLEDVRQQDPSSDTLLSEGDVEGVGRSGLSFLKENVLLPPFIFSFYRKELAGLLSLLSRSAFYCSFS